MNIPIILCFILFCLLLIIYKWVHFKILKNAIENNKDRLAIFLRFFSRNADWVGLLGILTLASFLLAIVCEFIWEDAGLFVMAIPFGFLLYTSWYLLYNLFTAIISITNFHFYFSKYVLYLRSFDCDKSCSDRQNVVAIQEYTNLKFLGIGSPEMLYHDDQSFWNKLVEDNRHPLDISLLYRSNKRWQNTVRKLMQRSQLILIKVNSTEGVKYEIDYALNHYSQKIIFFIEKKEDLYFFETLLDKSYKLDNIESFPALAFVNENNVKIYSIATTNIGVVLQQCLNSMREYLPKSLYEIDAAELSRMACNMYYEDSGSDSAKERRRKKALLLLWKSYCNGYTPAKHLLKDMCGYSIFGGDYSFFHKGKWCENLFNDSE